MIIFVIKLLLLERSEQEQIRIAKLQQLRALGIEPYPAAAFQTSDDSLSVKNAFEEGKSITIAGRLMSRRIQGKASFAELQDANGRIQLYFNRDVLCPGEDKTTYNEVYKKLLDIGDIIGVSGTLFTTQVGEKNRSSRTVDFAQQGTPTPTPTQNRCRRKCV